MDSNVWSLIKIARRVARDNPILGYELEKEARAHVALINPGAKSRDQNLESIVTVLKSLKQELKDALEKLSEDPDMDEFAKFFDDAAGAEEEELKKLLKTGTTAGPKDWLKKINPFKKKDKKKEAPKEEKAPADEDSAGMSPTYDMDDSSMDDFVEGKKEWQDPSHYVEQESNENNDFDAEVQALLADIDAVKKKPSKSLLEKSIHFLDQLIEKGSQMLGGKRDHQKPSPKVEITEEGMKDQKPAGKGKLSPEKLESVVDHYTDMLKESLGDEGKTVKFLKELFEAVGPAVKEDRAALAAIRSKLLPLMVRVAHTTPRTRPVLLPAIRRMASV